MLYSQNSRQGREVIQRLRTGLVTLTEELLTSAQVFAEQEGLYWDYDPAVLLIGPELLKAPQLESLFPPQILRTVYGAMNGREERYCQIADLTNLLMLQLNPVTPDLQRAVSQNIEAFGLRIPAPLIVRGLTASECVATIGRVTAFTSNLAPDDRALRVLRQSVPLVLSTAPMIHHSRDDAGRLIDVKPMQLTHEAFLSWFRERLILATSVTLERFPDNPLWMAPDESIRGAQDLAFQPRHYREWEELLAAICSPVKRGRRSRSYSIPDPELLQRMIQARNGLRAKGDEPTQPKLMAAMGIWGETRRVREWLKRLGFRSYEEFLGQP